MVIVVIVIVVAVVSFLRNKPVWVLLARTLFLVLKCPKVEEKVPKCFYLGCRAGKLIGNCWKLTMLKLSDHISSIRIICVYIPVYIPTREREILF